MLVTLSAVFLLCLVSCFCHFICLFVLLFLELWFNIMFMIMGGQLNGLFLTGSLLLQINWLIDWYKRSFSGVNAHVKFQVLWIHKRLLTNLTDKWSFSRVNKLVTFQLLQRRKCLFTNFTVKTFTCVYAYVSF